MFTSSYRTAPHRIPAPPHRSHIHIHRPEKTTQDRPTGRSQRTRTSQYSHPFRPFRLRSIPFRSIPLSPPSQIAGPPSGHTKSPRPPHYIADRVAACFPYKVRSGRTFVPPALPTVLCRTRAFLPPTASHQPAVSAIPRPVTPHHAPPNPTKRFQNSAQRKIDSYRPASPYD